MALRLCRDALAVDEVVSALASLLCTLGYPQACFAGHSYGERLGCVGGWVCVGGGGHAIRRVARQAPACPYPTLPPTHITRARAGTFCVSRVCQLHPKLVHSAVLLDPVSMLTFYPQLLHNFICERGGGGGGRSGGLGVKGAFLHMLARGLPPAARATEYNGRAGA